MSFPERLKTHMEAKGVSQKELADDLAVQPSAVNQWLSGITAPRGFRLFKIAQILGIGVEDLVPEADLTGDQVVELPSSKRPVRYADRAPPSRPNARIAEAGEAPEYPSFPAMRRDVPVYGTAQGGQDGAFELNSLGEPIDFVRRPPGLAGMRNVFAIYVEGESMLPWRRAGEIVFVHPARPPSIGDYVVVVVPQEDKGQPPLAYIKKLVRRTADQIITEQYNPPKEVTFPRHEGVRVLRVIDWSEAVGM